MHPEWHRVDTLAAALSDTFGTAPKLAIVLGSGLGDLVERLDNPQSIVASDLPGWPVSSVLGHSGTLHIGEISGVRTLLMSGRVHLYEGHLPSDVVRPIRAVVTWGVSTILLTNAAGGLDPQVDPGQLMVIEDHINLTGANPLVGPNDPGRGERFPDVSALYDPDLRRAALDCASQLGIPLMGGVYAGVLGPSYETPAEVRMLHQLGARAVGMSTVIEAIAAHHLGARICAFSTITNRAAGLDGALLDHAHVQKIGARSATALGQLLVQFIPFIGEISQ
ncbi:MAG: purine-nucleoside phosphorylase [Myxococcota bacterium]|nr:purine-nucleoside phosphorylase [Myxococcota bacterium]